MSKFNDFGLSRSEWAQIIDEWIFSERDRKLLKRRYLDCITYEALAEEFGLSTQRVSDIVYKSREQLFKHLSKNK